MVGWTEPEGRRPYLGALLLAYYDPSGKLIMPAGPAAASTMPSLNGYGGWGLHPLEKRRLVTAHVDSEPSCMGGRSAHGARAGPICGVLTGLAIP